MMWLPQLEGEAIEMPDFDKAQPEQNADVWSGNADTDKYWSK